MKIEQEEIEEEVIIFERDRYGNIVYYPDNDKELQKELNDSSD